MANTPDTTAPVVAINTKRESQHTSDKTKSPALSTSTSMTHTPSPDDRALAGKVVRDRVPRAQHSAWKKAENRPDTIDILQASDANRLTDLVPIRYGRMLQSPFAFYRGAAGVMAAAKSQLSTDEAGKDWPDHTQFLPQCLKEVPSQFSGTRHRVLHHVLSSGNGDLWSFRRRSSTLVRSTDRSRQPDNSAPI
jgi:hypothetical protein